MVKAKDTLPKGDDKEPGAVNEAEAEAVAETVAEPVPAAPGDDPESVFQRRMERLTNIVEEARFESGTALGDMVALIVELFKARPILWAAMTSDQQRDTVRHVEASAKKILSKVVLVIAQEESHTVEGTLLGQFTVKGETIEAKLKLEHAGEDEMVDVYRLAGQRVVIISADDKRFSSTRKAPDTPGNQPSLEFSDPDPAPAAHPEDDTDLADVDALYGVHDPDANEWLIDENGGDDGWTANQADAGKWPLDRAKELAAAFETEPGDLHVKPLADGPPDAEEAAAEE